MKLFTFLFAALLSATALAKTINVKVGQFGNSFSPDVVHAAPGDLVHFHFYPGNHAIARSPYTNACQPQKVNPIFSGFFNPRSGVAKNMFTVTVKDKNPIWLYCPQAQHCKDGMVMVINPPTNGHTLNKYKAAALNTNLPGVPKTVTGGKVEPNHN